MLMYHGTADVLIPSIKAKGLIPGFSEGGDAWAHKHGRGFERYRESETRNGVYLVPHIDDAEQFAQLAREMHPGSTPVVLTVHVPDPNKLLEDTAADYYHARIYPDTIPPSNIKHVRPVEAKASRIGITK